MLMNNDEYFSILESVKTQIKGAQYRAVLGINREQTLQYWNIGNIILENIRWGNKFIDNLARDIKLEFPNAKGYSVRNLKYMPEYLWYADLIIQNGLSLSALENRIAAKTYERQAIASKSTNYDRLLPSLQSELAQETLKSPYVFDFIEKRDDMIEREIENELIANIAKTIMELGTGFAFFGNR